MTKQQIKRAIVEVLFRSDDILKSDLEFFLSSLKQKTIMARPKKKIEIPKYYATFKLGTRLSIGPDPDKDVHVGRHWIEVHADDLHQAEEILTNRFGPESWATIYSEHTWNEYARKYFSSGHCVLILGRIV